MHINNTYSQLDTIVTGVPQISLSGPILFNLSINDLFLCVVQASIRFLCNDNEIWCEESCSKLSSMNVERVRGLCVELCKTINKLNTDFMRELCKLPLFRVSTKSFLKNPWFPWLYQALLIWFAMTQRNFPWHLTYDIYLCGIILKHTLIYNEELLTKLWNILLNGN